MSDPEAVKRAMESDDCAILRKQLADQDRAYIHHMNAVDTELAKAKAENERLRALCKRAADSFEEVETFGVSPAIAELRETAEPSM